MDIFLVAIALFYCYKVMKQSRSMNIFYGVLLFISGWIIISKVLEMKLLGPKYLETLLITNSPPRR